MDQTYLSNNNIEVYENSKRVGSFLFDPIQNKHEIKKLIESIINKNKCCIILESHKLYIYYENNIVTFQKYNGKYFKMVRIELKDNSFLESLKKLINYKENTDINILPIFLISILILGLISILIAKLI